MSDLSNVGRFFSGIGHSIDNGAEAAVHGVEDAAHAVAGGVESAARSVASGAEAAGSAVAGRLGVLASMAEKAVQPATDAVAFYPERASYFAKLDADPALKAKAQGGDAMGALLDILSRTDVPPALDRAYAAKAGSEGGGRVMMVLDWTRGFGTSETALDALKQGPTHFLVSKVISPMLAHFREVDGKEQFQGDQTMTPAFRDSTYWGPTTDQVGHMLCAVEIGARVAELDQSPVESAAVNAGLHVANAAIGLKSVEPDARDWARDAVIGHELIGDEESGGFLGQMRAYDKLVGNGDPDHVRASFDDAVAAVLRGDHAKAWTDIRAICQAGDIPGTPAELAAARAEKSPPFAAPGGTREGNSEQDVALSVYGFAMGYRSRTTGFPTADAARQAFADVFSASGKDAAAIDAAATAEGKTTPPAV